MPGLDGIETARRLAAFDEPPAVIFTTAYDDYALQAFDSQATGYLLKPVRREKLAAALANAARLTRPQLQRISGAAGAPERRTHIPARHRDELRLVPIDEVLYFVADQKYTTMRHADGEHLIEDSLRSLEEEFASSFVRIHRNALVSVRHLEAIERDATGRYQVRVRGTDTRLPVSRRMAAELRERFSL
jgi:two-component system response regulator AlgR